jgi:RNA polymerase sigma factor (sigma-70 family)
MPYDPNTPLSANELAQLTPDELVDYIRAAFDDGRPDLAGPGLAILSYRYLDDVKRRVSLKVPKADVEDVAMSAIVSALRGVFDGSSIGEFRSWLNTIVKRRIADYHRDRKREIDADPLASENADDERVFGAEPWTEEETATVDVESIVDGCKAQLKAPHALVIELYVFDGFDAEETAATVNDRHPDLEPPMSAQNVHQITSRFRRVLRAQLEELED